MNDFFVLVVFFSSCLAEVALFVFANTACASNVSLSCPVSSTGGAGGSCLVTSGGGVGVRNVPISLMADLDSVLGEDNEAAEAPEEGDPVPVDLGGEGGGGGGVQRAAFSGGGVLGGAGGDGVLIEIAIA